MTRVSCLCNRSFLMKVSLSLLLRTYIPCAVLEDLCLLFLACNGLGQIVLFHSVEVINQPQCSKVFFLFRSAHCILVWNYLCEAC